ncbi:AVN_collapsed_G0055120.mRNA.1.CDS.1 [Saccharomyces cerevisiae]|nr:CPS_HP_G0048330.mRNA.1.CDS.1 [Saccharomyces cerevisiae]CAI6704496.1 CPS_HP_G0048330.mRNA.1.CDS.1 [Saccharomyces cerevisiae]CAI7380339.1 AVN_collapsed_G0055120.mRNA.1.CDS.1 [Saccharomyces cerevisiae]
MEASAGSSDVVVFPERAFIPDFLLEWCSTPPSRSLHAVLARVIGHRCTTRCFFSRHQVACSQSNTRNVGWKYNLLTAHPRFPGHFSDRLFFFFFFFASHEIGTYLSAEESALDRYLSRFCGERESWDKCKKEMVGTKGQYTGPAVPPVPTTNLNDIGDPTKTVQ